jgi:hypothetical protein
LAVIKPAEYRAIGIEIVFENQQHLSLNERNKLYTVLKNFQLLFMSQRGNYKGLPIKLELLPGTKPYYGKPFPIPQAYQQIMKDEINRLESIGLLTKVS